MRCLNPNFARIFVLLLLGFFVASAAMAAPEFPALSGRVVDNAGLLPEKAERAIQNRLARHESETGNQVVVVTIPDLQGYPIEEYGYLLGRHWGIGQNKRDNGALLIVAKAERKLRIEVGYGLEGVLTDALSKQVIETAILPRFRAGEFDLGIERGVDAILAITAGQTWEPREVESQWNRLSGFFVIFVIMIFAFSVLFNSMTDTRQGYAGSSHRRYRSPGMGSSGYGSGGGFGRSGGFSGGGGGFGGGGASGGW